MLNKTTQIIFLVAHISILLAAKPASADQWGLPTRQHWSANKKYVLIVDWQHHRLSLKEKQAAIWTVRWSIASPLKELYGAPVAAYVTDNGQYVVLRDQWHAVGAGHVLVFLGAKGQRLGHYTLDQLLTQAEILDAPHTASSLWWSRGAFFSFTQQQKRFEFVTQQGTMRRFNLQTGRRLQLSAQEKQAAWPELLVRARLLMMSSDADLRDAAMTVLRLQRDKASIPLARRLLASQDAQRRIDGAELVGVLSDTQSLPHLKQLLEDQTVTSQGAYGDDKNYYNIYGVQLAAGLALARLLKGQAIPLLDPQLLKANKYMQYQWMDVYEATGVAPTSPALRELIMSRDKHVRQWAVMCLLKDDNGTQVRQNLHWLKAPDANVRYQAIRVLAHHAQREEANLLYPALADSDGINALWSLRGLIRLQPSNLNSILRKSMDSPHQLVAVEATIELARRKDTLALGRVLKWLADLPHQRGDKALGLSEIEDICQMLTSVKPAWARVALLQLSHDKSLGKLTAVIGALAAFGDRKALNRLRLLARRGEALDRSDAIEWLGICRDQASLPFLRLQLHHEEPWIRAAAKKALQRIKAINR